MAWNIKLKVETINKLEVASAFILLMYYVGALGIRVPLGGYNWHPGLEGRNILEKLVAALSYLVVPLLFSRIWKLCVLLLTKNPLITCFLFLTSVSVVWADTNLARNISETRGFLLTSLFGMYLGARFSIKEQARLLAGVFSIAIVMSITVALFLPGYGIHPTQGELTQLGGYWTGIFSHKNTFGPFMAWSGFIFLSFALSIPNRRWRLASWIGFALSCILVLLSGSAGSLVNLVGAIGIVFVSKFAKKTHYKVQVLLLVSLILLCGLVSLAILINAQSIASAAGKDLTFTGRIPLWSELLDYVAKKPLLGYGFNGFWNSAQYGGFFRGKWLWKDVPHSHNGFIELLLALGLIGFAIFALSFIVNFFRAAKEIYQAKVLEDIIPMQFLLTFFLANMAEAKLLVSNNIYWIIYVATAFSLVAKQRKRG